MDKNTYITNHPDEYFDTQNRALEDRLRSVSLPDEEQSTIVTNNTAKTLLHSVLGVIPLGNAISTVLTWNDEIDKEISEAKKAKLLEEYFNKTDQTVDALDKLRNLLTDPQGNVLFNKLMSILEDSPPDQVLINHLSSALKYITNKDNFHLLFESHKFALSQIEKLTPQALAILSDHRQFPIIRIGSNIAFGTKITSDWNEDFVIAYCSTKGIRDEEMVRRVSHSVTELISDGFMEAHKTSEKTAQCVVTTIGQTLIPYLNA